MKKLLYLMAADLGFTAILFLYLAGVGHKQGVLDLGQAFTLMRYCAYAGIAAAVLAVIYILWQRPTGAGLGMVIVSGLLGAAAFYVPFRQQQMEQSAPPIHDITTDTSNPPAFVVIAPLRADAPNPAAYDGEETARQQLASYPEISSMLYPKTPEEVLTAAQQLMEDRGWQLVDVDEEEGRLEATATTRWFGFKDDVVIRIANGDAGMTRFDMRSKSRVGSSDIGVNARRIRDFVAELNERLM